MTVEEKILIAVGNAERWSFSLEHLDYYFGDTKYEWDMTEMEIASEALVLKAIQSAIRDSWTESLLSEWSFIRKIAKELSNEDT